MSGFEFDLTVSLSLIVSMIAMIVAVVRTRRQATEERFKLIEGRLVDGSKRMDRHDQRIASIEQTVKEMPGKDDMHKLELQMARIGGTMERMEAVMEGNQKIMSRLELIVSRHEDHLLDGAKR